MNLEQEPENNNGGVIVIIAILISVLLLFIICSPRAHAFEGNRLNKEQETVKHEPSVVVDRHVLTLEDCAKDPSILVSNARTPVTVLDVQAVQMATTREIVYVKEPVETGVVVSATIESDDFPEPTNYPL